jgi:streptomycin 6-kinase
LQNLWSDDQVDKLPLYDDLRRNVVGLYGQAGARWLDRLPSIVADCAARWSLTVGPPFEPLSYNLAAPAIRADGTRAVLKVGVPNPELVTEIAALRVFDGHGAVLLLAVDAERGALLLERIEPGRPLSSLPDDAEATAIAARVMRQLWRPVPAEHPFPTVHRWAAGLERMRRRFDGGCGPFPAPLVSMAETLFADLLASMAEPVLLHGDLHHQNILSARRRPWLALDPKGVVGEPAYEVGALLRNPVPRLLNHTQPGRLLARRVDQLAEALGFDRRRLWGWGVAQAVLAAWWSYEDATGGWARWIACAEHLAAVR